MSFNSLGPQVLAVFGKEQRGFKSAAFIEIKTQLEAFYIFIDIHNM